MLNLALTIAFAAISLAVVLNLLRLVRGPSVPDRIMALDTLYINSIALLVLLGMQLNTRIYFEGALLIAMMGFVGTIALCKFVLRGDIIE